MSAYACGHRGAAYRCSALRFPKNVTHVLSYAHASLGDVSSSWARRLSNAMPSSVTGSSVVPHEICMFSAEEARSDACRMDGAQSTPASSTPDSHWVAPLMTSAKGPLSRMRSAMQ